MVLISPESPTLALFEFDVALVVTSPKIFDIGGIADEVVLEFASAAEACTKEPSAEASEFLARPCLAIMKDGVAECCKGSKLERRLAVSRVGEGIAPVAI